MRMMKQLDQSYKEGSNSAPFITMKHTENLSDTAEIEDVNVMNNKFDYFPVIIIGGGQAGLAMGRELKEAKKDFLILERAARIGDAWSKRWDSLRLFSTALRSSLPGMKFPADPKTYPTKDQVADYLVAYARRAQLPVQLNTRVESLERVGSRYLITTQSQRYECDQVVIATGPYQKPRVPTWARDLNPEIVQIHAAEYKNAKQLAPGSALVVGAGNTGAELALEIAHAGHEVWLSGRDVGQIPQFFRRLGNGILFWFLATRVFTNSTPIGRRIHSSLRAGHGGPLVHIRSQQLAAAGIERIPRVEGAQDGFPLLASGNTLKVANVIWCTGFSLDFSWVRLPIFAPDGYPIHQRGRVVTASGLYFLGLPFQQNMSSSLLGGVGRDAKLLAKWIREFRS
jgi:putative flavoprotein involved in K+ transport